MIRDIQEEILKLKKEKDICILAHCYQNPEILEVADFTGDSFALSVKAAETKNNINTTSELKTICDICVTSSSAVTICNKIENDKILFIPDCNLGDWVSKQIPDKTFKLLSGGCPTHARMSAEDVKKAKAAHPNALFLVHPECKPEVVELADYVGSTTGIMNYAKESDAKEFIIGTENSIVTHLQMECPDKMFYPLSKDCVCHNMKATTLTDVLNCCKGIGGLEINLDEDTRTKAKHCIDEMIRLG